MSEYKETHEVSTFNPNRGTGTIRVDLMKTVTFDRNQFKHYSMPKPGMKVEVTFNADGSIKQLDPVQVP